MQFNIIANMLFIGILLTAIVLYCVIIFAGYRRFTFTTVTLSALALLLLADRILTLFNINWIDCFMI